MKEMKNLELQNSILVIVPHSDDEILMFGGLIQRALREKKAVNVCLVTNGDYEATTEEEGIVRPRETIRGLEILGLPRKNIYLLGYADTGMPKTESFLWQLWENPDENQVLTSHVGNHTYGPQEHPDFHRTVFETAGDYTKAGIRKDLCLLLEMLNPDAVYTTHPQDAHGDHAGLYEFVAEQIGDRKLFTGFCHSVQGDGAWPLEGNHFTCPPDLKECWDEAWGLELTEAEAAGKAEALEAHQAALKPDAVEFLHSFMKKDEVYFQMENEK